MSDKKLVVDLRNEAGELDAREKSPLLAQMLWTAADRIAEQGAEIGGWRIVAESNQQMTQSWQARATAAEAERDRLRAALGKINAIYRDWHTGCTGSNDAMISIAGILPDSAALEPPR